MRPWTLRRITTRLSRRYHQYLLRSRAAPGSVHDHPGRAGSPSTDSSITTAGVDDAFELLARREAADVLLDPRREVARLGIGRRGDVRRDQRQLPQRVVVGKRLGIGDVEGGAADRA